VSKDIALVLIGGIIGLLSSLLTTWFSWKLENDGNIKVYCRIVGSSIDHKEFGVYCSEEDEKYIRVSIWVDMFNTSGLPKFIRDFNVIAFDGVKGIMPFMQIQASGLGKETQHNLGNNQMYSFIIEPHSVKRYETELMLKEKDIKNKDRRITSLKTRYYDEKDQRIECVLYRFKKNDVWKVQLFDYEKEWIKI
jgi:hypothetical protein